MKVTFAFIGAAVCACAALMCGATSTAHAQTVDALPPAPTQISASLLPSFQIYVAWNATVATSGDIVGYYLYRNGGQIATVPGHTFYTDAPGSGVFSYTVAAYDAAGTSPQSKNTSLITVPSDTVPPSQPQNFAATVSSSSVALTWQASTDNIAVIGYYLYRNGVRIATTNPITGTSYTDTGLTSGATYQYAVIAYDASGNLSNSTSLQATTIFDITPPSIPQYLTATSLSPNAITLIWQPSTDNIAVAGYYVYRNGALIASVGTSSPSYVDASLTPQTSYQYAVAAYDEVNNISARSTPAVVLTKIPDTTRPSVPNNIAGVPLSSSVVKITWDASTDNVAVAGYYVYRNGNQIATTASTSYMDFGLATSTTYEYAVDAYDTSNNVSAKTSVAVTTLASSPAANSAAPSPLAPAPTPPPVTPAPVAPTPTANPTTTTTLLSQNLYLGERTAQVTALQSFLIQGGYLGQAYATGYFGSLTQAAVRQYQCAKNIVCSGSPATTGWGSVGPHTRAVING